MGIVLSIIAGVANGIAVGFEATYTVISIGHSTFKEFVDVGGEAVRSVAGPVRKGTDRITWFVERVVAFMTFKRTSSPGWIQSIIPALIAGSAIFVPCYLLLPLWFAIAITIVTALFMFISPTLRNVFVALWNLAIEIVPISLAAIVHVVFNLFMNLPTIVYRSIELSILVMITIALLEIGANVDYYLSNGANILESGTSVYKVLLGVANGAKWILRLSEPLLGPLIAFYVRVWKTIIDSLDQVIVEQTRARSRNLAGTFGGGDDTVQGIMYILGSIVNLTMEGILISLRVLMPRAISIIFTIVGFSSSISSAISCTAVADGAIIQFCAALEVAAYVLSSVFVSLANVAVNIINFFGVGIELLTVDDVQPYIVCRAGAFETHQEPWPGCDVKGAENLCSVKNGGIFTELPAICTVANNPGTRILEELLHECHVVEGGLYREVSSKAGVITSDETSRGCPRSRSLVMGGNITAISGCTTTCWYNGEEHGFMFRRCASDTSEHGKYMGRCHREDGRHMRTRRRVMEMDLDEFLDTHPLFHMASEVGARVRSRRLTRKVENNKQKGTLRGTTEANMRHAINRRKQVEKDLPQLVSGGDPISEALNVGTIMNIALEDARRNGMLEPSHMGKRQHSSTSVPESKAKSYNKGAPVDMEHASFALRAAKFFNRNRHLEGVESIRMIQDDMHDVHDRWSDTIGHTRMTRYDKDGISVMFQHASSILDDAIKHRRAWKAGSAKRRELSNVKLAASFIDLPEVEGVSRHLFDTVDNRGSCSYLCPNSEFCTVDSSFASLCPPLPVVTIQGAFLTFIKDLTLSMKGVNGEGEVGSLYDCWDGYESNPDSYPYATLNGISKRLSGGGRVINGRAKPDSVVYCPPLNLLDAGDDFVEAATFDLTRYVLSGCEIDGLPGTLDINKCRCPSYAQPARLMDYLSFTNEGLPVALVTRLYFAWLNLLGWFGYNGDNSVYCMLLHLGSTFYVISLYRAVRLFTIVLLPILNVIIFIFRSLVGVCIQPPRDKIKVHFQKDV